jgi:hypothetical protein
MELVADNLSELEELIIGRSREAPLPVILDGFSVNV